MSLSVDILTIPIGSQFTQNIGTNDPDDLNDFKCVVVFSGNATTLELSDFTLTARLDNTAMTDISDDASLVSLDGKNSVYELVIRPPEPANISAVSAILTLTLAANAVTEGNPTTTKTIRISKVSPDTDAEVPTALFDAGTLGVQARGIAITPTRFIISSAGQTSGLPSICRFYNRDGTEQTAEQISIPNKFRVSDYFNGTLIGAQLNTPPTRYSIDGTYIQGFGLYNVSNAVHTRLGMLQVTGSSGFAYRPYDSTKSRVDIATRMPGQYNRIAHHNDLLYMFTSGPNFGLAEIIDDTEIKFIKRLNINANIHDIAIFGDTLYALIGNDVHTLDIRKYRPIAKNTKYTIYPQFASVG